MNVIERGDMMIMGSGSLFAMALLVAQTTAGLGHQHDRPGVLRPRIGIVSEEVVRQKLKSYGLEIVSLERRQDTYVAQVRSAGKPTVLEINRLTGALMQEGKSVRLRPYANAISLAIKPDPKRVPWVQRTIRFDKIGVEGLRQPAQPKP